MKSETLLMNIVTPTTKAKIVHKVGVHSFVISGANLVNNFTLQLKIPCEKLLTETSLYWVMKNHPAMNADIPAQHCGSIAMGSEIKMFKKNKQCWIDTRGNTLWRTATELSIINKRTVYQNLYAIFLTNKKLFRGDDINNLVTSVVKCPSNEAFQMISSVHAKRLFKDAMAFRNSK